MVTLTYEAWKAEGVALFGEDATNWRFKCVRCGNVQTIKDFLAAGVSEETARNTVFFSCLGRFKEGVGCDWTLGGLFSINKRQVIRPDTDPVPVFEFDSPVGWQGEVIAKETTTMKEV
jgi:hypothetical protein